MHVIGHGRYAREAYPQAAAAGGGSAGVPLPRQRFIAGDTTNPGPGVATAPFATIAAFMTSRTDVSAPDAAANYVGWLTPKIGGYTEDVNFPPYVSTELRGASTSPSSGTAVTGNAVWANVGPATPGAFAVAQMYNVNLSGSLTITDDAGAPAQSAFFCGADSIPSGSIQGGIDAHSTTKLQLISLFNISVTGGVNANADAATRAAVDADSCTLSGSLFGKSIGLLRCNLLNTPNITAFTSVSVFASTFGLGTNPIVSAPDFVNFDGPSWISFLEAGGTRNAGGDTGTKILVNGGYTAGVVEGAPLPTTGVNTNVSLNGTGASVGFQGANSGNHYTSTGLAADGAIVTLKTGGSELNGDTIAVTKTDLAAHALAIHNNAGVTIATIPSGSRGFVIARFSSVAGDWVFAEGGSLAA